ncbi:hypothetical protein L228DRAFT_276250 [Xylona heveae TC161]|uniref:TOG domain-containing protein n=1 Tax=Xylona heveae (strain CBS 132557 / TC161) TaxID=1328760 RepID=A0A165HEK5_XYLHT|nr:hypothetical protein L228DRAFT_276250 [Xylona heveae TC161]KZF23393.1 hypothetical protein L228DRAFT_276250 [Xylona heveae TC161]
MAAAIQKSTHTIFAILFSVLALDAVAELFFPILSVFLIVGAILLPTAQRESSSVAGEVKAVYFLSYQSPEEDCASMAMVTDKDVLFVKNTQNLEAVSDFITHIKADVKHKQLPEDSIIPLFQIVRISISSPHSTVSSAGFSLLVHLLKRLNLQGQAKAIAANEKLLLPYLLDRLGDQKDRYRTFATLCLTELWLVCPQDVERAIKETALTGKNSKSKEAGMSWICKMNKEHGLAFRSYVPRLMECLEDADGFVRERAKSAIVDLFRTAPEHAKSDLKRQLHEHNIRKSIAAFILESLDLAGSVSAEQKTPDLPPVAEKSAPNASSSLASSTGFAPEFSRARSLGPESDKLESAIVNTQRELDEIFKSMYQHFEGKETEQNWMLRDKSILKLRQLTKGNAPIDFPGAFAAGIKFLMDGILKVVNSLRTTLSTSGCLLIQEVAKAMGPGIDHIVEWMLHVLIKLCGHTKKISAQNGNATVEAILGHVSYNVRLVQFIYDASQEKNAQPRAFAAGWLKTIITREGVNKYQKQHFESSGGFALAEKCIRKGLTDANPAVKEGMRAAYWVLAKVWPATADSIMSSLDANSQKLLQKASGGAAVMAGTSSATATSQNAPQAPRPSLRDAIAAQKRAKKAAQGLPERPESAQSSFASTTTPQPISRPNTLSSSTSSVGGGLMSAPVRPMRPGRRAEIARPATAEPFVNRRPVKPQNVSTGSGPTPIKSGPRQTPVQDVKVTKDSTPAVAPADSEKTAAKPPNSTESVQTPSRNEIRNMDVEERRKIHEQRYAHLPPHLRRVFRPGVPGADPGAEPDPSYEEFIRVASAPYERNRSTSHRFSTQAEPIIEPAAQPDDSLQVAAKTVLPRSRESSPKREVAKNENRAKTSKPLKVYEDPISRTPSPVSSHPPAQTKALEELTLNEPANVPVASFSGSNEEVKPSAALVKREEPKDNVEVVSEETLPTFVIPQVRARTFDMEGFASLRRLILGSDPGFDDEVSRELLAALVDYVRSTEEELNLDRLESDRRKTLALPTVMNLLQKKQDRLDVLGMWYPYALAGMLETRSLCVEFCRVAALANDVTRFLVESGERPRADLIDPLLAFIEKAQPSEGDDMPLLLGIQVLRRMFTRMKIFAMPLSEEAEQKFVHLAERFLSYPDARIRRKMVECCVVFQYLANRYEDTDRFWSLMMPGLSLAHRDLITYYQERWQPQDIPFTSV